MTNGWLLHQKWRNTYLGRRNREVLLEIEKKKKKKRKIKNKKFVKNYYRQNQSWGNWGNMYSPKPGHWPSQQQYLNINSGCHATENSSEETISKSSQIRELLETMNF